MKRKSPTPWTAADIRTLKRLAKAGKTARQIADAMGRRVRSLRAVAQGHGIELRLVHVRHQWSAGMDDFMRAHYSDTPTAELAETLGVSQSSVYGRAGKLGLRKSEAFLESAKSGRVQRGQQDPRLKATQFKPGLVPWNKGVKGSTGHHPNCRRTQFKPGVLRGAAMHNYVPIGSLRISRDGQLERKVADDPDIYPARRWVAVARIVWEEHHGPIPKKHVVRFKPGMHTTEEHLITVDKLECISQRENLRRNSRHHNYGPEVNRLMQLRGAMTRRINNLEKKLNEHNR